MTQTQKALKQEDDMTMTDKPLYTVEQFTGAAWQVVACQEAAPDACFIMSKLQAADPQERFRVREHGNVS